MIKHFIDNAWRAIAWHVKNKTGEISRAWGHFLTVSKFVESNLSRALFNFRSQYLWKSGLVDLVKYKYLAFCTSRDRLLVIRACIGCEWENTWPTGLLLKSVRSNSTRPQSCDSTPPAYFHGNGFKCYNPNIQIDELTYVGANFAWNMIAIKSNVGCKWRVARKSQLERAGHFSCSYTLPLCLGAIMSYENILKW